MIASVGVDYHVTRVVDGTKGVHGMIPKRRGSGSARRPGGRGFLSARR